MQKFSDDDKPSPQLLQYLSGSLDVLDSLRWSLTANMNKKAIAKMIIMKNEGSGELACNNIFVLSIFS